MSAVARRIAPRVAAAVVVVALLTVLAVLGKAWYDSRLPGDVQRHGLRHPRHGGGPEPTSHAGHVGGTGTLSVSELHGPAGLRMHASS